MEFKTLKNAKLKDFLTERIDPKLVEKTLTLERFMSLGFTDEEKS